MQNALIILNIVIASLCLVAAVVVPLWICRWAVRRCQTQTAQFISNLDRNLGAATKLLEVRDYYQETHAALDKMLQEAYKEGNRFRQDQIRRLIERLNTMKVRTLDKQVRILESESDQINRKKRHRRRRAREHAPAPQGEPAPPKHETDGTEQKNE